MAAILDRLFGLTPDPKVTKLFLMDSPLQVVAILTLYVLFVKKWGPNMMKNRQAFELKGIIMVYNSFQVAINAYFTYEMFKFLMTGYIWQGRCLVADISHPENVDKLYFFIHSYLMIKFVDLLDTVFFVLRKRYRQVSFLHVYHHIMISLTTYVFMRYLNNGPMTILGLVNSAVHAVMYFYYLLSALWPNAKNQLWFKKYITLMQIAQFIFLFCITMYPLVHGDRCGSGKYTLPFYGFQCIVMITLFTNFYIRAYIVKAKAKV